MPRAGQEIQRAPVQRQARRLSKGDWLEASMQILDAEGVGSLTIENLTTRLGVTQGSFYWHFKSHPQFLRELMAMWAQEETFSVGEALAKLDLPPRDTLREVMRFVTELDRAHLEMKFRHLVAANPFLQEQLREVDDYRYQLVEGLFRQLGFRGKKLRARTYAFVVLVSLEYGLTQPMNKQERLVLLDERLALFVD